MHALLFVGHLKAPDAA